MAVQKYKITKTFVDSIPLSPDKQVIYRDSELTGFAIRVSGVKSFIAEKKMANGVPCRVTIGQYGVWTVAQAREQAKEYLLMMSKGINPNVEKNNKNTSAKNQHQIDQSVPTLNEAYASYKQRKNLSENSVKAYDACINDYYQDWKDFKLNILTKKMILDRHFLLSERSMARANLAAKFLRAIYNHVLKTCIDDHGNKIFSFENPVDIIQDQKAFNKIKRRKTYIRSDQHHAWALAVATTMSAGEHNNNFRAYTNQDYMFLMALTGFRRSEAESAKWEDVDLKFGTITVKDTKNGEDLTLPMGDVLWHIMNERKKRAGKNRYVFQERFGDAHIIDRRDARKKITEKTGITFTFHDLRRTFSSVANSLAIGGYTIKRLINHTFEDDNNDVTDGYIQVSFNDMRKAMNMIEEVLIPVDVKALIFNRIYFVPGKSRNQQDDWDQHNAMVLEKFLSQTNDQEK